MSLLPADKPLLDLDAWPRVRPVFAADPAVEARIDVLLAGMSMAEKVGQVVQADIASVTPEDVRTYHLGAVLNGGNSAPGGRSRAAPAEWLALADAFWLASAGEEGAGIPVIWGTDSVHGNNNVVGATIFPHNAGLGATGDVDLFERIGRATALEMRATGQDWTFAPTLAVTRDDRWGRTYESYSESAELVARFGAALVRGLQGRPGEPGFLGPDHVVATAKHFVGDGATEDGRDQGETIVSERDMRDVHAVPYAAALEAGLHGVMASFSGWQGQKMHGREDLLTGLLKRHWNFDGVVVGDWNGHGQLPGCSETDCPDAIVAGLDMYMAPDSWKELAGNLLRQVREGVIPVARLDDAVRRVLRVKARAGLLDAPRPSERPHGGDFGLLGCEAHVRLADEAVRKSAVLLKNAGNLLPLRRGLRVLVVGAAADDIGTACGGWSLSWQGGGLQKPDYPHAETLLDGIRRIVGAAGGTVEYSPDGEFAVRPDVAIAVYGERPYAEFRGDLETLDFCPGAGREAVRLRRLKAAGIPVVSVFYSGRPLWVNPELNASDAFVAAFLPGTRAGALADLLFAAEGEEFTGRLSFSWPRDVDQYVLNAGDEDYAPLFPFGFGLSLGDTCRLGELHEKGAGGGDDGRTVFDLGSLIGSWRLELGDAAGVEALQRRQAASPGGTVQARPADYGRQENALRIEWSGDGSATFLHDPLDLRRESNADFSLRLAYVADDASVQGLEVLLLGEAGSAEVRHGSLLPEAEADERRLDAPLKWAAAEGSDLSAVHGVQLRLRGEGAIILTRIAFEMVTL
ncbi:MAG: glycoside hydrolase family 3 C-terminal domain-containing protein [Hyphomonas sp.]|nr:glycoside hydrolase family 3 C-terminal domain-containing protein [Hyphomonas sp.]